jgi:hypothetical protein
LLDGVLQHQRVFEPIHWQPTALLEQLVREGKTLAQWQAVRA